MDKQIILVVLVVIINLCTSCNREVNRFLGDYSYKLSGEVAVENQNGEVSYRLVSKSGQMNVLKDHASSASNRVLVTMNEVGGSCYTFFGTVSDNMIKIDPYSFSTNIITSDNTILGENNNSRVFQINASGSGYLNGDILIVDEQWDGSQSGNANIRIRGEKMTILAERN